MLIITLVIAALTLIERKFLALNQRRVGPYYVGYRGRLQYIADALKLFIKGVVVYDESNKFWFVAVPSVCGLICYFFWVNSVWCPSVSIVDIEYNLVYATLLSISFSFCIILLGYFSGNKYTRLASIRASLMVINLELFLGLMILTTVVVTESFCFSVFVEYQKFWWLVFTYFGLAGLLCLLFLLEVGRTPFDLAEAESELVTGYSTEIGGFTFGIFYLGEYFHLFFFSSVMSIIFLGGWEYPNFLGFNYFADYNFLFDFFIATLVDMDSSICYIIYWSYPYTYWVDELIIESADYLWEFSWVFLEVPSYYIDKLQYCYIELRFAILFFINDVCYYVWYDTFLEKIYLFVHAVAYPAFAWITINTIWVDIFVYQCSLYISDFMFFVELERMYFWGSIFDMIDNLIEFAWYDAYYFVVNIDESLMFAFDEIFNDITNAILDIYIWYIYLI